MRSKTTIVSCTLKPITVSTAVMNSASSSMREETPEDREHAEHQQRVVHQRKHGAGAIAPRVPDLAERKAQVGQDPPQAASTARSDFCTISVATIGETDSRPTMPAPGNRSANPC